VGGVSTRKGGMTVNLEDVFCITYENRRVTLVKLFSEGGGRESDGGSDSM
jgi:hypothetical protein